MMRCWRTCALVLAAAATVLAKPQDGEIIFPDEVAARHAKNNPGQAAAAAAAAIAANLGQAGQPSSTQQGWNPQQGQQGGSQPGQAAAGAAAAIASHMAQQGGSQQPAAPGGQGGGGSLNTPITFPEDVEIPCTTHRGETGSCRLLVRCSTWYAEIAKLSRSQCDISPSQKGVCCPPRQQPQTDVGGLISKQPIVFNEPTPDLQLNEINHACNKGLNELEKKKWFEKELVMNNIVAEKGSTAALHAQLFQTTQDIINKGEDADKNLVATINLVKDQNLSKGQGTFALPQFGVQNTVIADTCPPEPQCSSSPYRAIDAACNNLQHRSWGMAGTAFQRILPSEYDDGVNTARSQAQNGSPLPSSRDISAQVIHDRNDLYVNLTILIMQWGQFLDHDITHTPITKGSDNTDITCCLNGQHRQPDSTHPACMPITISPTDSFYASFGQRCMEFVRSMPAVRPRCNFGPREQMNQITSFIDASNVYGSTEEEMNELRLFQGGLLKEDSRKRGLLPENRKECVDTTRTNFCFKAGDSRVNEQPQLAVMHTIWMRQHNQLARNLSLINAGWEDERLFQEARRIVAAQMQHITYSEYLPIVLGRQFMERYGVLPLTSGYSSAYRQDVDPSITNEFATAAFRYGHTLISNSLDPYTKFGTIQQHLRLSENQFSPFFLYTRDGLDNLVRGLAIQPSQKFDRFFSKELTNHLFAGKKPFGMDLVALNIQRARDHGLAGYNQYRRICKLPLANSFNDLADVMDAETIQRLSAQYQHVNDIDLFIGGIAERPVAGSLLGHTFLCIVGDQFARLKLGDRFYYENGGLPSSFTEHQLYQIRKTSLARVLCDNADVEMMQPLAFVQGHLVNKRASCHVGNLIPRMSLDPWRNDISFPSTHK